MRRSDAAAMLKEQREAKGARKLSPEEEEAKAARIQALIDQFFEEQEKRAAERKAQRGLTKIVDAEARVAVEGDTDLNHDNLEG